MNKQILPEKESLIHICKDNDIQYLGLFGSVARGEETKQSDVDIVVDFKETKSLFEKGRIVLKLQGLFNREIDLINLNSIKPNRKDYIMQDLITVYEEK